MKLIPALTALLVAAFLYLLVLDRDRLRAVAQLTHSGAEDEVAAADAAQSVEGVRVVVQRSESQEIESAVILRGRTEAARQVEVQAETQGTVISEPLRKGTFVDRGDTLCELDPGTREASLAEARARLTEAESRVPTAEAAKAEAEARLREAEINLRNARRLSEGGYSSETSVISFEAQLEAASAAVESAASGLVSARAGIEAAQAAVAGAEREIEELTIHAPFAGLLETDTAELGLLMQPGSPCATVVQLDPIKLVGFAPEVDVEKIMVGAPAKGTLASGQTLTGRVSFVSRSADESTRTFRVEVSVPNEGLQIRDGQTAEILVAANGKKAHLLPQSALTLDDQGRLGVRIVATAETGAVARFVPVTLLRDTVDGVWLTGLDDQTEVIVVGQEYVTDGVAVAPSYREPSE